MRTMWAPNWGLSGRAIWDPGWECNGDSRGVVKGSPDRPILGVYGSHMGRIWVPYGQLISVYNNNSCMYEYVQPFGKREHLLAMTSQLFTAVTMTVSQNPSLPPSRLEPGTFVSKTIALTTNLRLLYEYD